MQVDNLRCLAAAQHTHQGRVHLGGLLCQGLGQGINWTIGIKSLKRNKVSLREYRTFFFDQTRYFELSLKLFDGLKLKAQSYFHSITTVSMSAGCMRGLSNPFPAPGVENVLRQFGLWPPLLLLREEAPWKNYSIQSAMEHQFEITVPKWSW